MESCPLYRHQELFHPDGDFDFEVRVLSKCFGKPTRRMITEAVKIGELKDDESMNSKKEWTYIALDKIRSKRYCNVYMLLFVFCIFHFIGVYIV